MEPKILIPTNIKNKIQFMVDNSLHEISGLGTVVFDLEENAYRVTDVMLIDQEVGAAHTDLDDAAVATACYEMRDAEGELAFWWHSHVNMPTFWSTTDHATMDSIGTNGLCVAVVFNKKCEMRGAIVMSPNGFPQVKLDNVDIEIEYEYDFDTELLLAEMKQKVRPKVYTQPLHGSNSLAAGVQITAPAEWGDEKQSRQLALNEWSKMLNEDRKRYANFEDFFDEYMWDEYTKPSYAL